MRALRLAAAFLPLALLLGQAATAQSSPDASRSASPGDVALGARLFSGEVRFARGGPACAHCHDNAALPRPGGGTMGPDLTNLYGRIGPEGVQAAVDTLFFPTMMPLFSTKPLTADERNALAAYLESTNNRVSRTPIATASLGGVAMAGFVIGLGVTALAGRSRIRSVRLALLARSAAGRGVVS